MNFYPERFMVELIVPFVDKNGQQITPVEITAKLLDGEDAELSDFGSIPFVALEGQKTIIIPAVLNELSGDETREARVLVVEIETANGTISHRHSYVIEAEQTLRILENTFMTLENAEILSSDSVNLEGWKGSNDVARRAALVEAYRRITRVPLHYYPKDIDGRSIIEEEVIIYRDTWDVLTKDDFLTDIPSALRRALRQAQLVEANQILEGDGALRRQRAGIISETIGESSVRFSGTTPNYGLGHETFAILAGFIYTNNRIVRV